ncbi:MAG TPA: ribosome-associated translation inhibitor RaiA [candidate division Zixibacteria bacterium]|jgi:putative sigma-54 modulation protein|nr:ribosome-associated translation inhibitor RaiA [candidate division Zixibacteria bacterium]
MQMNITTRHYPDMTDALRAGVEDRLFKMERFFDRILEARVILTGEKHRHQAEITLHLPRGKRLSAKEVSTSMETAVDMAAKKIESQVKKFKEKRRDRKRVSVKI